MTATTHDIAAHDFDERPVDTRMMTHRYSTIDVPVDGGRLHAGIWDPIEVAEGAAVPTVLAIHGVTSSHLVWPHVVAQLPHTRIIAPDLRGRGASRDLAGEGGMAAHARDMIAVLEALSIESLPVIGHSMGGFVSVVLAHLAPQRVERLVLIDGGLPLNAPAGLDPEDLVQAILGPTAARLSMRFASVSEYLDFWRDHPAFRGAWTPVLEDYFAYDLVPDGNELRPATSLRTTKEDTVDMNTGSALPEALAALGDWGRPVLFTTVPRGLQDDTPGLYPPAHVESLLPQFPSVRHLELPDLNHYTVVLGTDGAAAIGARLREELG